MSAYDYDVLLLPWRQREEVVQASTEYTYLNGFIKYHVEHLRKEVKSLENMVFRFLQTLLIQEDPEQEYWKKFQSRFVGGLRQRQIDGLESDYPSIADPDNPDKCYSYCLSYVSDHEVGLYLFEFNDVPGLSMTSEWFYEYLVEKFKQGGEDELLKTPKRLYAILDDIRSQVQTVMDEFQPREITELKLQLLDRDEEIRQIKRQAKEDRELLRRTDAAILESISDIGLTKTAFKSKTLKKVRENLRECRKRIKQVFDAYYATLEEKI
ncbi:hypothetical protein MYX06_00180 [Patescibacteria group bacterium AH-259-L05]|nr:hypothetical protein [Patescibacteria group bacterium AH-259-L05]